MRGQGHQAFADELARFAGGHVDPRVTAVVERVGAPLRVVVRGRRGVGRTTVADALHRAGGAAGIAVTEASFSSGAPTDVVAYVTTEVVKPEDAQAIAAAGCPVVAVLNKADLVGSLSGRRGDGPIEAARARCAELSALVGVQVRPMIGLLAVTALDGVNDASWAALGMLAAHPRGATCLDDSFAGFLAADNPVPTDVRMRLLDALDLFGTAVGIAAVRQGRTADHLRALLRRTSGVDAVLTAIAVAGAEVRYRRVLEAVAELEALAVGRSGPGDSISEFLSRDDTVIARMAAAADLAEAAGLGPVKLDPVHLDRHDAAAHLLRAVRWQRYSRGGLVPATDLHRACGADIARGSLRLWSRACGPSSGGSR